MRAGSGDKSCELGAVHDHLTAPIPVPVPVPSAVTVAVAVPGMERILAREIVENAIQEEQRLQEQLQRCTISHNVANRSSSWEMAYSPALVAVLPLVLVAVLPFVPLITG